jgi:hypothetical protein
MVHWKVMPRCRECGKETPDVQFFLLALNGRQLRGYWHPACFNKVQRDVITATLRWVESDDGRDE